MKTKNLLRTIVAFVARRHSAPAPPPRQLDLGLDQITDTGLPLGHAIPVRSAEYWLQLGEPDLALRELQTLPESVRQHPWPLRVHLNTLPPREASPFTPTNSLPA